MSAQQQQPVTYRDITIHPLKYKLFYEIWLYTALKYTIVTLLSAGSIACVVGLILFAVYVLGMIALYFAIPLLAIIFVSFLVTLSNCFSQEYIRNYEKHYGFGHERYARR